ncbi:hypothetical protein [Microbulbifer sp. THAF38]|uniref:hypothetical protein n=1 Tax=Microbulbifer sp. THAF38 TaxID=2587856 RepID=UPI0012682BDA|nr:hypothetical protein [Microbulbifer sp. THAF38]QFT55132.1 hypothetical protein FIU95_11250 [Microbulbifer sp. THAF38]
MSRLCVFILVLFGGSPVLLSAKESCEEKLEIASKVCVQVAENTYSEMLEITLTPGFDALNHLEVYHLGGVETLLNNYDLRIDYAVVGASKMLKMKIPEEDKYHLHTFLSRAKDYREKYPGNAIDTKYSLEAREILSKYIPPEKDLDKEKQKKIILDRLRELIGGGRFE